MSALKTETVSYKHGGVEYEGYLAYDGATYAKRPGVLLAHAWFGQDPQVRRRAVLLAQMGYAAFAIDMYGGGKNARDTAEAAKLSSALRAEPDVLRERAKAGLDALRSCRCVESRRIAAIGYCFGGAVVLEMARANFDLVGVVSFHGLLDTSRPATAGMRARILALHGASDPLVAPDQVRAFQDEMTRAGADWQMISYGGAVHAFTNTDAGADRGSGLAYDEAADRRSWQAMKGLFIEIF